MTAMITIVKAKRFSYVTIITTPFSTGEASVRRRWCPSGACAGNIVADCVERNYPFWVIWEAPPTNLTGGFY